MDKDKIDNKEQKLDPFLSSFLKDYKPKTYVEKLTKYSNHHKCPRLAGFKLVTPDNVTLMNQKYVYVKYIPHHTAYADKDYNEHVKAGGILLHGGYKDWSKHGAPYTRTDKPSKWTVLTLMYIRNVKDPENMFDLERIVRIFKINMNNHYVFFQTAAERKGLFSRLKEIKGIMSLFNQAVDERKFGVECFDQTIKKDKKEEKVKEVKEAKEAKIKDKKEKKAKKEKPNVSSKKKEKNRDLADKFVDFVCIDQTIKNT